MAVREAPSNVQDQDPSSPPASDSQVPPRKRPLSEEEEEEREKRQRLEREDNVPEQIEGTSSEGSQPVDSQSLPTSLPCPVHSLPPYQPPQEETEGESSDGQGHCTLPISHKQLSTQQSTQPQRHSFPPVPSRLATIMQGYWYLKARQRILKGRSLS